MPGEKRLAVEVEDHPIEYNKFEGTIPKGQYGGGTVMLWDRGAWEPEDDPHRALKKGHLKFRLEGEKLSGSWHLVRMRKRPGEKRNNWLLIKSRGRVGAQAARQGHPRGDAAVGHDRPHAWIEIAKAGKKPRMAEQPAPRKAKRKPAAKETSASTSKKAGARAARDEARPKPRQRRQDAKAKARKRTKTRFLGRKPGRLPDFIPPALATLSDKGAGQRQLAARDQVRRLSHPGPH